MVVIVLRSKLGRNPLKVLQNPDRTASLRAQCYARLANRVTGVTESGGRPICPSR